MKNSTGFPFDCTRSGLFAAPYSIAETKRDALAGGLAWFDLDLAGAGTKAALLARCQTALGLPVEFGHNWDALADSLEDLSWRPARGYVVFVSNGADLARQGAADFATALEIFSTAAIYWSTRRKLFLVLLDDGSHAGRTLKALGA